MHENRGNISLDDRKAILSENKLTCTFCNRKYPDVIVGLSGYPSPDGTDTIWMPKCSECLNGISQKEIDAFKERNTPLNREIYEKINKTRS